MATAHNLQLTEPSAPAVRPLSLLFAANFRARATSGIGNHLTSLADALRSRGHQVEILWSDSFAGAAKWGAWSRIAFPYAVAQWIREQARRGRNFDVVNVHEPAGLWCALWRKWDATFPGVVVTSHGIEQRAWKLGAAQQQPSLKSRIVYPLTQLQQANYSLRHADRVAVLSSEDAHFAQRELGVPAERIAVLSNGVDERLLNIQWQPSTRPRLLFIGTWIPRKGTELIARVFRHLREERAALELWAVGTSASEEVVRQSFAAEDRARVTVRPSVSRDELAAILAHDQVFILPSQFEGMPLSLLEAMAAGLPCVASDTCGARDVIIDGQGGLLLDQKAERSWLATLNRLLGSAELRRQLGARARAEARRRTWSTVSIAWEQLFAATSPQPAVPLSKQYDQWHGKVVSRDDLETDLKNPWHTFARRHLGGSVRGLRVLDAACGRGQFTRWLAQQGARVTSADFSFTAARVARQRSLDAGAAATACADVSALPFSSRTFDLIVSCETLEHVPSPAACLREFARVLRPGGRLLLTTESYLNIWSLYRVYGSIRRRTFNTGDVPQPIENWFFSPLVRHAVRRAGFTIKLTDGEEHHLYLWPRTNPSDCEFRFLSRNAFTRRLLRYWGRRFYVIAERRPEATT